MERKHDIKVNFPETKEDFIGGYGEGMFVLVDDEVKKLYDGNADDVNCWGTLDSDSFFNPELVHGKEVRFQLRGEYRPVAYL